VRTSAVRRARRDQQGAAALEFAVILPLVMVVLFGIIEFGIAFTQTIALNNGARQGARLGAVAESCDAILTETRSASQTLGVDQGLVSVSVSVRAPDGSVAGGCAANPVSPGDATLPCEDAAAGSTLVVTTTFLSPLVIPLSPVDAPTLQLTGTGEFRCEYS
jgi:Flp pilus assembly protein TadG